MMASAQRAHLALRYSKSLSHTITERRRGGRALPAQARFQLGDQVFYWRGNNKTKADWAFVWHGPAIVIGFERNNVWIQHRGNALKCASNHLRHAQQEELVPWDRLMSQEAEQTLVKTLRSFLPRVLLQLGWTNVTSI